ncbi:hypothetical protein, partial [Leptolyngbya ectocarpi]|uniref:hypothetical protein n=1 Tax=Leptolyngbya ectocarpi TaxID=1202 RepID=UPI001D154D0F
MFENLIKLFSSIFPNSVLSSLEEELGFMEDLFSHLTNGENKLIGRITLAWWLTCLFAKGMSLFLKNCLDCLLLANQSFKFWAGSIRTGGNHII